MTPEESAKAFNKLLEDAFKPLVIAWVKEHDRRIKGSYRFLEGKKPKGKR